MSEERIYSLLLSAKEISSLYFAIGTLVINKADFINYSKNSESFDNSIKLLIDFGLIDYKNGQYKKVICFDDEKHFIDTLISLLISNKTVPVKTIFDCDIFYDSFSNGFYVNRNSIKLTFSGLVMLYIDLGVLSLSDNRLYFRSSKLLNSLKPTSSIKVQKNSQIDPSFLDKVLELERELGIEAEEKALAFEKRRLIGLGINLEPIHISKLDCKAGFDIASFESNDDKIPSRFIEVKSTDKTLRFFISKNEVECAKMYGDKYFMYLYNREKKSFVIIQNPYKEIFSNDKWEKSSQLYECYLK